LGRRAASLLWRSAATVDLRFAMTAVWNAAGIRSAVSAGFDAVSVRTDRQKRLAFEKFCNEM